MSSKIVLWKLEVGPPSWSVRMLGDILGLQFELKDVDFFAKEHKTPDFLKLNPMGTLPVIQDGDFVISESHTIMKYLLAKYGDTKLQEELYPSEFRARALVDQVMFFNTGVAFIKVKLVALPAFFEGVSSLNPQLAAQLEEVYGIVELYLERNRFVAGDHVTLADISLGGTISCLRSVFEVDSTKFPRTADWQARLEKETFFSKIAVPYSAAFGKLISEAWEANKKKLPLTIE